MLEIPKHIQHVENQYGVKVGSVRLVLLIGSQENYDRQEVREASRSLRDFELIDYDTLRASTARPK